MSFSVKNSVLAAVVSVFAVSGSFSVQAADQISLNQLVAYNLAQRVAEVQFVLDAQVEGAVYNMANRYMQDDVVGEGMRPVVKMSDIEEQTEEE